MSPETGRRQAPSGLGTRHALTTATPGGTLRCRRPHYGARAHGEKVANPSPTLVAERARLRNDLLPNMRSREFLFSPLGDLMSEIELAVAVSINGVVSILVKVTESYSFTYRWCIWR